MMSEKANAMSPRSSISSAEGYGMQSVVKDHSRNTSSTSSFSNHKADTADEEIALEPIKTVRTNRTSRTNRSSIAEVNYALPLQDLSRNIVGWDGIDDTEDPRNWPLKRKISVMILLSCITFISPLASSMFAPGVSFMMIEFGNSEAVIGTLVVSILVFGWAIGPLILSPLSEIYGRRRVLDCANFFFAAWQIGCALAPNIETMIVFRFLAGLGGSGCLVLGGGVISDLFSPEQRGLATAGYSLGPLFGPVVGPIAGGFIAQRAGWRWVFWVLLIASTILSTLIFFINEETNPRVLLARKTEKLRIETGNQDLISWYDKDHKPQTPAQIIKAGLLRPLKLIFLSPISALMCSYMAIVYGILYLLFTSLPAVFAKQYGFSAEISGLAYLGVGIGFFIGVGIQAKVSDATVLKFTERNGGVMEPEFRLPACAFWAMFLPASLVWYGWSAEYQTHWIVPIIGMMPFGIGMMGIFIPIQAYMIDAFTEHAASALAALTCTRSLLGAFLPLAGTPMYDALGFGWGNTLLAFVALFMGGAVWGLYKYGKQIREKYPVNLD